MQANLDDSSADVLCSLLGRRKIDDGSLSASRVVSRVEASVKRAKREGGDADVLRQHDVCTSLDNAAQLLLLPQQLLTMVDAKRAILTSPVYVKDRNKVVDVLMEANHLARRAGDVQRLVKATADKGDCLARKLSLCSPDKRLRPAPGDLVTVGRAAVSGAAILLAMRPVLA